MPQVVERRRAERVRIHYREDGYDAGGGFHRRGSTYEVSAADGESAEYRAKKAHPDAIIDGMVTHDRAGNPSIEPTTKAAKAASGVTVFDAAAAPEPKAQPIGRKAKATEFGTMVAETVPAEKAD